MTTAAQRISTATPCPECHGLRQPAQVCNGVFLLPSQPTLLHEVAGSARLQALVCVGCGYVSLYTKLPTLVRKEAPTPDCFYG